MKPIFGLGVIGVLVASHGWAQTSASLVVASPAFARGPGEQAITAEARIVSEFHQRVRAYLADDVSLRLPGEDSPDDAAAEELCRLPDVPPRHVYAVTPRNGTIFIAEIDDMFRQIVTRILSPIDRADVLRVMPLFPGGVPVQFVSPSLFRALPQLPQRLEYRFQQHDLVILDLHTGVTVDSLSMVIGPSTT